MKVLFTGGGTGGHFYPIIAIVQQLNELIEKEKLVDVELYFMSDSPYNERLLFENRVAFKKVATGKMRRYFSLKNITDTFKTFFAVFRAFFQLFSLYPDVVVGKGGYATFPVLFAARLLRIPVIIHESDSVPGRVNKWASKFAKKIAISFPEAIEHLPRERTALTGNPIRREIEYPMTQGGHELLELDKNIPTILILGGSQGAQIINEVIINSLPRLLERYQIVHQVGPKNVEDAEKAAAIQVGQYAGRYKMFGYLDDVHMRAAAGAADLIISRAGSAIFEIAVWGKPSIIIPITNSNGDHQRKNAFSFSRVGACDVIEEQNLTAPILASEIERLIEDPQKRAEMGQAALQFGKRDAALKIAEQIMGVLVEHQK